MPLVEKQLYDPFSIYAGQIFDWNKLDLDHDVHTFRQLLVRALQRHDSSIPIIFGGQSARRSWATCTSPGATPTTKCRSGQRSQLCGQNYRICRRYSLHLTHATIPTVPESDNKYCGVPTILSLMLVD